MSFMLLSCLPEVHEADDVDEGEGHADEHEEAAPEVGLGAIQSMGHLGVTT